MKALKDMLCEAIDYSVVTMALEQTIISLEPLWQSGTEWTPDFVEQFINEFNKKEPIAEIVNINRNKSVQDSGLCLDTTLPIVRFKEKCFPKLNPPEIEMRLRKSNSIFTGFFKKLGLQVAIVNKMLCIGKRK